MPKQTQLVKQANGQVFSQIGAGWSGVTISPKVTQYTNADNQVVYKVDYTGTGLEFDPGSMALNVQFKVNADAVSALQPFQNTEATTNTYNGKTYDVASATKGGKDGESTSVVMLAGDDNDSNVSQYTGLFKQSNAQNLHTILTDSEGNTTTVSGLSSFDGRSVYSLGITLGRNFGDLMMINAPEGMILSGAIQDNQSFGTSYSTSGVNNPMKNDKQSIRLRLANNTASTSTNVGGIINLPTEVTANKGDTPGKFALQMTGAATEGKSTAGDSTTTLYSNSALELTDGGKSVTLTSNGHKYYFNAKDGTSTTTADDLMTADKVGTKWSSIVGIVTSIPKLASQDMADVILPVKDPDSINDRGKQVTIPTYFRVDGLNNVTGSITDSFTTTAHIKNVDQDGKVINGFPGSDGGYSDDGTATPPVGVAGSKILNNIPTVPGYVFTTTDGDTTIKLDGSATLVNHFQVDKANLVTQGPGTVAAKVIDTALGNDDTKNPNTGAKTATGTNDITFKTTDADLAKTGTYKVTGPDGKSYDTLADALVANPAFDLNSDAKGATQTFTVTYTQTPVDKDAVVLQPKSKVYDGDATTDPTVFDVKLGDDLVAPTAGWTADDFDTTGITSQNVGSYDVKLSAKGLSDLQAANTTKTITMDDVTNTQFTITKAPITITGPTLNKVYDASHTQQRTRMLLRSMASQPRELILSTPLQISVRMLIQERMTLP
ncbi:MBG domain-containing protein [Lentilactobacillus rapi]|uniref:MBG domain-containing protein n=1 Tax=Lentilactobacillus rapi TaxID=481723 RepID=UPI0006CF457E|nr:MBG domain-containing protein [Lentilactobacillus rapi]